MNSKLTDREWVLPEVCAALMSDRHLMSDLADAMACVEDAMSCRAAGDLIGSLIALRQVIRDRLSETDDPCDARPPETLAGPWRRRLRRGYEAALCEVECLIPTHASELDGWRDAVRQVLARLRRLQRLEDRAHLDSYWVDLGVGD